MLKKVLDKLNLETTKGAQLVGPKRFGSKRPAVHFTGVRRKGSTSLPKVKIPTDFRLS